MTILNRTLFARPVGRQFKFYVSKILNRKNIFNENCVEFIGLLIPVRAALRVLLALLLLLAFRKKAEPSFVRILAEWGIGAICIKDPDQTTDIPKILDYSPEY